MQEKLDYLIDKKYNYKGKIITINKWKKVNSAYVIFTDKQTYNFFESELNDFITELIPIQTKEIEIKKASIKVNQYQLNPIKMENTEIKNVSIQEDLNEVLLDTINKLKTDKTYINQANAICNVVSQMINIKKLELQISRNTR